MVRALLAANNAADIEIGLDAHAQKTSMYCTHTIRELRGITKASTDSTCAVPYA